MTVSIRKQYFTRKKGFRFIKNDLRITKFYRSMTLPAIAVQVYNTLILIHILSKIKKKTNLMKNQIDFWNIHFKTSQIQKIRPILKWAQTNNLETTLMFVDSSRAFDSIHRGNIKPILHAYSSLKEILTAILMLYKNTNAMVHSTDGDNNQLDIVTWALQRDTQTPYLFILS